MRQQQFRQHTARPRGRATGWRAVRTRWARRRRPDDRVDGRATGRDADFRAGSTRDQRGPDGRSVESVDGTAPAPHRRASVPRGKCLRAGHPSEYCTFIQLSMQVTRSCDPEHRMLKAINQLLLACISSRMQT
jgi:hypothetical protein